MLIVESKKFCVPVQDSISIYDNNKIVGYWNELDKVFILSTDILYFATSTHIGRKNALYVSEDKTRNHYYIRYIDKRRINELKVSKNRFLIYKGKLSYQLLKCFRIHKEEKSLEMEMMMKKITRLNWF